MIYYVCEKGFVEKGYLSRALKTDDGKYYDEMMKVKYL